MDIQHLDLGLASDTLPESDVARQAVDSLRGYVYQGMATALAWLDIEEDARIYLEVAEDYSILAKQALRAVQIKDTKRSGSVTLNSKSIWKAITAFVDLVKRNPEIAVELRFFTTSPIGTERAIADRPAGIAGLEYWRKVALGADPEPLRTLLESEKSSESVRAFVKARDNDRLRLELIRNIHWDCGKPDLQTLRQELEERLVVVGRDLFHISVADSLQLVDYLVYHVLETSTVERPLDRVLTRSTLYRLIDAATLVSVPRNALADHALIASQLGALLGARAMDGDVLASEQTDWFIDGSTLPVLRGMVAREGVESQVTNTLENFGAAVLVGGSGLGKSIVSRTVVDAQAAGFVIVNFRSTKANETRVRLDMVFARVGGLIRSPLILEDLDELEDPPVSLSLARVIEALRRRYLSVIITCHRRPHSNVLTATGLDPRCIVECPYFSEKEAGSLVSVYRGDPTVWGRLAHIAGGFGHPQLTHAFASGMAARQWPVEEIHHILSQGVSSDDIDAARDAARRNLVSALPDGTRNLLYRLSLTFGRFDRSLALTLGEIPPRVPQSGESMDQLIGPWIEEFDKDLFRVSPLVSGSGGKMLAPDEQRLIHESISLQMLRRGTVNASDIDTIFLHALAGKSVYCLTIIAHMVLSFESDSLERLAEHVLSFRFIRTNVPIYPDDIMVSGVLRLAQFQLAAAGLEGRNIPEIAAALFDEIASMPEGESKRVFEYTALTAILGTMGIANYLDNWLALLLRFETMIETSDLLQSLTANVEERNGPNFLIGLFNIGIAKLSNVRRLENIIDQFDEIDTKRRALLLTPIDEIQSDYSTFVNGPWVASRHDHDFDAEDAASRYRCMAEKTESWGIRSLSLQCSVAQAIMLDEYRGDKEGALAVLNSAVASMGDDRILSRAKAKVYWRHDEHDKALTIYRSIADQVGVDSPVERAFALREAAISAAKCGAWLQAKEWFLDAQSAAKSVRSDDMEAMAVGLGADSAVAALEIGNVAEALTRLADALEALSDINADSTLRAAHCHRLIRHTVMWAQSRIQGSNVQIGGLPIRAEPGSCSNPDPLLSIQEHPLGHIDIAWYMLAEAETAANLDKGVASGLDDRLDKGPIPSSEFSLRRQVIQTNIRELNATGFWDNLVQFIEITAYLSKEAEHLLKTFNVLAPERRQIPSLDLVAPFDPEIEEVAKDAILAYGIHSILANKLMAMTELNVTLDNRFKAPFPGKAAFRYWNGQADGYSQLDEAVMDILRSLSRNQHLPPYDFWFSGLRLFEWINRSSFKHFLTPGLSAWQRSGWRRILTKERFALSRPMLSVPPIEEVLTTSEDNNRVFIAKLLLTTSDAVGSPLGSDYQELLKYMAEPDQSS